VLSASLPALRAFVWHQTLPAPVPPWRRRFHALALGSFVHNVAPGRMGPLASAWVLGRETRTSTATAFSSLLVAKLLELAALFGLTALLALLARARGVAGGPAQALLVGGFIALVAFTLLMVLVRRYGPRLAERLSRNGRWPRLTAALLALGTGLDAIAAPRRALAGLVVAVLPVIASALAYGIALRHLGVSSYLVGGGLLVGAITLGQFTPFLPVGMGVYYLVCAGTARALGVPAEGAAALAALSHAVTVATNLAVGVGSALAHRDRLGDLLRRPRAGGPVQPAPFAPPAS
jgi:glycosyltransferase 2 family protein